jgi:hypothetical protein
LEDVVRERAKAKQKLSEGRGQKGTQISADLKPTETRKEIAKIAGVSHDTIDKIKVIEREATPEQKEALTNGTRKVNQIYREIKPKPSKVGVDDGFKTCNLCGVKKPIEAFHPTKNTCKSCTSYVQQTDDCEAARINIRTMNSHIVNGVDTILEDMKKIAPLEEGADKAVCDSTISQLVKLVNGFNLEINRFLYIGSTLRGQVEPKAVLQQAVSSLNTIIKMMEG